jgi:hypothetical protein
LSKPYGDKNGAAIGNILGEHLGNLGNLHGEHDEKKHIEKPMICGWYEINNNNM